MLLYIDSLIQYVRIVAGAAPNTSLYYYHLPSWTGVDCKWHHYDVNCYDIIIAVPMEQLLDAQAVIPTLKGIKYSAQDLSQYSRCLTHSGGKMQLFYGCDEVHLCVHMYLCLNAITIATVGSISYGRRCSYWQVGVLYHHGY